MTDNKLVEAIYQTFTGEFQDTVGPALETRNISFIEEIIRELDGRHGWKLVPVEPTGRMDDAADDTLPDDALISINQIIAMYRSMLTASPDPLGDE